MLDRYFVRANGSNDSFADSYSPDQSVVKSKLVNDEGRNLQVLFPPWHGGAALYEQLIRRLAKRGDAVLAYYFHDEVLRPNISDVPASYTHLRETVTAELERLTKTKAYDRVHMTGLSLGNTFLATVSSEFHEFDSATLVCTASSLARSMWYGIRTQKVRAGIESAGYSLEDVENAWSGLAPETHIGQLKDKAVHVLVSTKDEIIPTEYQLEYVDAANASIDNLLVSTTRLGHYAAIGRYCLYGSV